MIGVAALWLAFGGIPDPGTDAMPAMDAFDPIHHADLVGLQDVDFDSGWVPVDSPVQLRLYAKAADSVDIEMFGVAGYDWDAETLGVVGDDDGGWFAVDVGVDLHASVRFDVAGIQWESDLLGPFDYTITAEAMFTPYLLPGDPQAPVSVADHTDGVTVASVPIVPDIIIASGNLDIDIAADVEASLQGRRVELRTQAGGEGTIDTHGSPASLDADAGADPLVVDGTMVCGLQVDPTIILRPHLTMSILGQDFDIFGIDLPIMLPPTDDELVFEPQSMAFAAPPDPPDMGTSGSASGGVDDSGGGDDTSGDATTAGSADGGDSSGDGGGMGSGDGGDGCACRLDAHDGGGAAAPCLMLLGLARRRRSRRQ